MRLTALFLCIMTLTACTEQQDVELKFSVLINDEIGSCDASVPALNDLRFFASEFHAITADGQRSQLGLRADNNFQSGAVALVDLESGEGRCLNGTPAMHAAIELRVPLASEFEVLEFTVGVPFALNHQNPLTAEAPLDDAAMHWHWRSGYKFMRAGVATGDNLTWLHLGSTGCEGATRSIISCKQPNRVLVQLAYEEALQYGILIDLDQLFANIDWSTDAAFDCSSGPLEESCQSVFPALGLGTNAAQTVFRVATE